jgi:hypothetical protein
METIFSKGRGNGEREGILSRIRRRPELPSSLGAMPDRMPDKKVAKAAKGNQSSEFEPQKVPMGTQGRKNRRFSTVH